MSEVERTDLPGIGVRSEFSCVGGTRIGVVTHRGGRRDLLVFGDDDPDAPVATLSLGSDDARTLAELLGGSHVEEGEASRFHLAGLSIDWIDVAAGSALDGVTIGESQVRSRTGASVVAIIGHERDPVTAPGPDTVIGAGETIVAVGDDASVERLRSLATAR